MATIFRILRVAENSADAAEDPRRSRAAPIDPQAAAGGQTANIAEQSIRIRHVSPQKVSDVSCRIGREIDLPAIAQWFYLRGYPYRVAIVRVVERFNPERVAREKDTLSLFIPDDKRVHAAQFVQHRFTMSLVKS